MISKQTQERRDAARARDIKRLPVTVLTASAKLAATLLAAEADEAQEAPTEGAR